MYSASHMQDIKTLCRSRTYKTCQNDAATERGSGAGVHSGHGAHGLPAQRLRVSPIRAARAHRRALQEHPQDQARQGQQARRVRARVRAPSEGFHRGVRESGGAPRLPVFRCRLRLQPPRRRLPQDARHSQQRVSRGPGRSRPGADDVVHRRRAHVPHRRREALCRTRSGRRRSF